MQNPPFCCSGKFKTLGTWLKCSTELISSIKAFPVSSKTSFVLFFDLKYFFFNFRKASILASACKNGAGNNNKRRLFLQISKNTFEGALMCIINNISPACISEDGAETRKNGYFLWGQLLGLLPSTGRSSPNFPFSQGWLKHSWLPVG